jgi:hypothetical protein
MRSRTCSVIIRKYVTEQRGRNVHGRALLRRRRVGVVAAVTIITTLLAVGTG